MTIDKKQLKRQARKELFQTVIFPVIMFPVFFFWVVELIFSQHDKLMLFLLSILMLVSMYFVSGTVPAGVLLSFMTIASFMLMVIASASSTRLIVLLQTLWLWSMYSVLVFYKTFTQKHHNRILVEDEIISTDIDILRNKTEDEKKHVSDLNQRLLNYKYLEEMTVPLSSTMQEENIVPLVTDLAAKFIGKGSWKIHKSVHGDMFASYVNKYKVPLLIQDIGLDNRFYVEKPGFRSLIAVPFEVNGSFWGILKGTSERENVFDEGDLRLLSILGGISSIALANAQLYKKTQELAITDGLTGLYVQSYFKERLAQEFVRSKRYQLPLTITMIDIDHFKDINDTYGHNAGDEILRQISGVIRKRVRDTDFVSRYGGEEFGVIMLQTNVKEAQKVSEDIRKNIRKEKFFLVRDNSQTVSVEITVSIGVAALNDKTKDSEHLIAGADSALYMAKSNGRNRTEISEK